MLYPKFELVYMMDFLNHNLPLPSYENNKNQLLIIIILSKHIALTLRQTSKSKHIALPSRQTSKSNHIALPSR